MFNLKLTTMKNEEGVSNQLVSKDVKSSNESKKDSKSKVEIESPKTEPEKESIAKPESQTGVIRSAIKSKKTKEQIEKELSEKFSKSASWAVGRLKIYEKAYGVLGINDKHI